jgi:hypothetical protein
MTEEGSSAETEAANGEQVPELDAKDLEKLCEMVRRLVMDELRLERERSGALPRDIWR